MGPGACEQRQPLQESSRSPVLSDRGRNPGLNVVYDGEEPSGPGSYLWLRPHKDDGLCVRLGRFRCNYSKNLDLLSPSGRQILSKTCGSLSRLAVTAFGPRRPPDVVQTI